MLEDSFSRVYTKFKLHFYQEIFARFQSRESSLTPMEAFCMEVIHTLNGPTVNEFASFIHISSPNAAYKINSLIQKGYIEKVRSSTDRREYHLRPTEKYMEEYNIGRGYSRQVIERVLARLTPEETGELDRMLSIVGDELMPEIELK